MNGWVKVRRGLAEHLPDLSDAELRVFMAMILHARNTGTDKGIFFGNQVDLARISGCSRSRTNRAVNGLIERGWVARIDAKGYRILKFENPTSGISDRTENPTSGIEIPLAGYRYPTSGIEIPPAGSKSHQRDSTPYYCLENRRKGEGPDLTIDYENEFQEIRTTYPKKSRVTDAQNFYNSQIVEEVNFGAWLERVKANARICAATPPSQVQWLPNLNDFIRNQDDDYEAMVRAKCEKAGEPYRVTDTARADEMARVLAEVGEDLL